MNEILATFRPDLFVGKRVLVSGGTSGIGLGLAKAEPEYTSGVSAKGSG